MNLEYVYLPQNVSNKNVCFGRRSRDRKPNFVGGRQRQKAGIVGWWVGGWVGGSARHKVLFRAGWKHMSYIPGLENMSPWNRSDSVKERQCGESRMEIYFSSGFCFVLFFISPFYYISCMINWAVVFRNAKWCWLPWVTAVSLAGDPPESQLLEFQPNTEKDKGGWVDDDKSMVNDIEGVQSLVEGEIAPWGIGFVFMWWWWWCWW